MEKSKVYDDIQNYFEKYYFLNVATSEIFYKGKDGKKYSHNPKTPIKIINGKKYGLTNWSSLTDEDYIKDVAQKLIINKDDVGIGLKLGKQLNKENIICLDFDWYNKDGTPNVATPKYLEEWNKLNPSKAGLFNTSTKNSMACLVKVSDEDYNRLVKYGAMGSDGLEIFLKNKQQVIPPTCTPCKITKELRERKYCSDKMFCEATPEQINFIENFMKKVKGSKKDVNDEITIKVKKTIKIPKKDIEKIKEDGKDGRKTIKINQEKEEKNIDLLKMNELADIIKQEYIDNYNIFLILISSLKAIENSESSFEIVKKLWKRWSKYDENNPTHNEEWIEKMWNGVKTDNISGGSYFHYAKLSNNEQYINITKGYRDKSYELQEVNEFFIAQEFNKMCGFNYLIFMDDGGTNKNEIWEFSGINWVRVNKGTLQNSIRKEMSLYYQFIKCELVEKGKRCMMDDDKEGLKAINELEEWYGKLFNVVNKVGFSGTISDAYMIENQQQKGSFEFERQPNYICFKNCVIDCRTGKKVIPNPEDYMFLNTGYSYEEPTKEEMDKIEEIWISIFPEKELREFVLKAFASGLYGRNVEKIFMLNGEGGNGKGLLTNLMKKTLGEYAYVMPSISLTKPIEDGGNPAIANCSYKRFAFSQEPDEKNRLHNGTCKALTGDDECGARKNYSNDMKTYLRLSLFIECNRRPNFLEEITEAELRRLFDILFGNIFKQDLSKYKNCKNVRQADPRLKDPAFTKEHRNAFFKYLLPYYKQMDENEWCFDNIAPSSVLKRTREYLQNQDKLFSWFENNYIKDEDTFCSTESIFNNFDNSSEKADMVKDRKWKNEKIFNLKGFRERLKTHLFFKPYYVERERSKKNINKCLEKMDDIYNDKNMDENEYIESEGIKTFNKNKLFIKLGLLNKDGTIKTECKNVIVGWRPMTKFELEDKDEDDFDEDDDFDEEE